MNPKLSHATVRPAAQARSLIASAALAILLTLIIASCGDDYLIKIWDVKSGKILRTLQHEGNFTWQ